MDVDQQALGGATFQTPEGELSLPHIPISPLSFFHSRSCDILLKSQVTWVAMVISHLTGPALQHPSSQHP